MGEIKKKLLEVGDLENIESYDMNRILVKKMGFDWLYAFESDIGSVNLVFQKITEDMIEKLLGENRFFLEGYNICLLINGRDFKLKAFKVNMECYNKILKTCLECSILFINKVRPVILYFAGEIEVDTKGITDEKETEDVEKAMRIKSKLYREIVRKNLNRIPGYKINYDGEKAFYLQRGINSDEKETEKIIRLDKKNLLEGYILKLLKELK